MGEPTKLLLAEQVPSASPAPEGEETDLTFVNNWEDMVNVELLDPSGNFKLKMALPKSMPCVFKTHVGQVYRFYDPKSSNCFGFFVAEAGNPHVNFNG